MYLGFKKSHTIHCLSQQALPNASSVKLLGFTIDTKCTSEHTNNVCKKLAQVTHILCILKPLLMEKYFFVIYYGLSNSSLSYGLQVWSLPLVVMLFFGSRKML